jgi:hypothetical protein
VEPFRLRYLELGLRPSVVAYRLGWLLGPGHKNASTADTTRLKRTLGLMASPQSRGKPPCVRRKVTYEMAVQLADALEMEPHEAGV